MFSTATQQDRIRIDRFWTSETDGHHEYWVRVHNPRAAQLLCRVYFSLPGATPDPAVFSPILLDQAEARTLRLGKGLYTVTARDLARVTVFRCAEGVLR